MPSNSIVRNPPLDGPEDSTVDEGTWVQTGDFNGWTRTVTMLPTPAPVEYEIRYDASRHPPYTFVIPMTDEGVQLQEQIQREEIRLINEQIAREDAERIRRRVERELAIEQEELEDQEFDFGPCPGCDLTIRQHKVPDVMCTWQFLSYGNQFTGVEGWFNPRIQDTLQTFSQNSATTPQHRTWTSSSRHMQEWDTSLQSLRGNLNDLNQSVSTLRQTFSEIPSEVTPRLLESY